MALAKSLIATLVLLALVFPSDLHLGQHHAILYLALSGIAGIALGDTLYFATLTRLGARLTLLMGTLIPLVTALAAMVLFEEYLAPTAWLGIAITLGGIGYVLWERNPDGSRPQHLGSGLVFALGFVIANTVGILLTKSGVVHMGSLEATLYREAAASFALGTWGAIGASLMSWMKPLANRRLWLPLLTAAMIGTFLGTWFSVAALKYTYTAVAATLNATSPLFILPLGFFFAHEAISRRALGGALIAVIGIGWYYFSAL